jgi:M6 family metalloprotease-like protein
MIQLQRLLGVLAVAMVCLSAGSALPRLDGFGHSEKWHDFFSIGQEIPLAGDFNGDGMEDVITFVRDTKSGAGRGDVIVALSTGLSFGPPRNWHGFFSLRQEVPGVGDFNGDGMDDIISFVRDEDLGAGRGDVWVALSTGANFGPSSIWHDFFSLRKEIPLVGDFNGDGKDDIISFVRDEDLGAGRGDVWVALSTGSRFETSRIWHDFFSLRKEIPLVGDFNGDGKDDIISFVRDEDLGAGRGDVWVALSTGSRFETSKIWHDFFSIREEVPLIGDFNGDGRDDIVTFVRDTKTGVGRGDVIVALSTTTNFGPAQNWHEFFGIGSEVPSIGDFNGDGRDDICVFKRSSGPGAQLGDVLVALTARVSAKQFSPPPAEFGWDRMRVNGVPARGGRDMLVILLDFSDIQFRPSHNVRSYTDLYFGVDNATKSVTGFYRQVSGDKFWWNNAGVIGPFRYPDDPTTTSVDESTRECAKGNVNLCPGTSGSAGRMRTTAIQLAAANGYDFTARDRNGDRRVTGDELQIVLIIATNPGDAWGAQGSAVPNCVPVRGISVCGDSIPSYTESAGLATIAHEIAHSLGAIDLYNSLNYNARSTVMTATVGVDDERWTVELDAWHKIQLGWVTPKIYDITEPGACEYLSWYPAGPEQPVILFDPRRGTKEFFLLEFRSRADVPYDEDAAGTGLALWYVKLNPDNSQASVPGLLINPGPDTIVQSVPPQGSDDQILDFQNDGRPDLLVAGPDRILQTSAAGDDQVLFDNAVFLLGAPFFRRGFDTYWTAAEGQFSPGWLDGTVSELVLQVAQPRSPGRLAVKWGRHSLGVEPRLGIIRSTRQCYAEF